MGECSQPPAHLSLRGWFHGFKSVTKALCKMILGETVNVDTRAASKYPSFLQHLLGEGWQTLGQVCNVNENAIYWRKGQSWHVYIACHICSYPGRKFFKDRFTVLFCLNACGTPRIKPTVIHCCCLCYLNSWQVVTQTLFLLVHRDKLLQLCLDLCVEQLGEVGILNTSTKQRPGDWS